MVRGGDNATVRCDGATVGYGAVTQHGRTWFASDRGPSDSRTRGPNPRTSAPSSRRTVSSPCSASL